MNVLVFLALLVVVESFLLMVSFAGQDLLYKDKTFEEVMRGIHNDNDRRI